MINFLNSKFVKSCKGKIEDLPTNIPEVLVIGRSNVGKSSLINTLTNNSKMAYVSSKPGHTKLLNYFLIDNKFHLVDAPGYGYSALDKNFYFEYEKIMDNFFDQNSNIKLVVLLIDSRRGFHEYEIDLMNYLNDLKIDFCIVFTKVDKTKQQDISALKKQIKELSFNCINTFYSRIDRKSSLDDLKSFINNYLNL